MTNTSHNIRPIYKKFTFFIRSGLKCPPYVLDWKKGGLNATFRPHDTKKKITHPKRSRNCINFGKENKIFILT